MAGLRTDDFPVQFCDGMGLPIETRFTPSEPTVDLCETKLYFVLQFQYLGTRCESVADPPL